MSDDNLHRQIAEFSTELLRAANEADTLTKDELRRLLERARRTIGFLAASVFGAGPVVAGLPTLRRIDPIEPYPLAVDLDGVAVDHRSPADDQWLSGSRRQ